jgi:hypothetical protein
MIRVRYPDGTTFQYNDANYLHRDSITWDLYSDAKETKWIASIQASAGAIVEAVPACRIYNAAEQFNSNIMRLLQEDLSIIRKKITKLSTAECKRRKA